MKFSAKVSILTWVLLAVILTFSGFLTVHNSFNTMYEATKSAAVETQNGDGAVVREYIFASDGLQATPDALYPFTEAAVDASGIIGRKFAVYVDGTAVFSNLPTAYLEDDRLSAVAQDGGTGLLRDYDGRRMLLISTDLAIPGRDARLLAEYDVTQVFTLRDMQARSILKTNAIALGVGFVLIRLLCGLLAIPLRKIHKTATAIAGGDYSARTGLRPTSDLNDVGGFIDRIATLLEANVNKRKKEKERSLEEVR